MAAEIDCNLLVFEHSCGSSISVLTRRLRHLLPELESDAPLPVLFGTEQCPGHCRSLKDLEACDAACGNVRDRALILIIQCLKQTARQSGKASGKRRIARGVDHTGATQSGVTDQV
jgi:hypothetical protein